MRGRDLGALLALALVAGPAASQVVTTPPTVPPGAQVPPPDTTRRAGQPPARPRFPGDTARDTTKAPRELVKWPEPDSVAATLLGRSGYIVTRYRGHQAVLSATGHGLSLAGDAAVQRDQTILVADTIFYNDSTRVLRAAAPPQDTIFLRDPSQGTGDLLANGYLTYNIERHFGTGRSLTTSSTQAGRVWYIYSDVGAVQGDTSSSTRSTSYAEDGTITSCDLPEPHYHFQAKEIKVISKRLMVARPAVLYVADIPVLWLPFIFQDMRSGRRSGMLPPRFGLTDVVRTSPNYQRSVENVGYYFAISDYMDALVSLDWRSSNGTDTTGLGWMRYNGEWRYRWLDRFLSGGIRASYSSYSTGDKTIGFNWTHTQQFSQSSSLNANVNYVSNTTAYQRDALTVAQALAAISSSLALQQRFGPANVSIGGTRRQFSGRPEVNQDFPTLNVSTNPISLASWLIWTPSLALTNTQDFNLDVSAFRFFTDPSGALDSSKVSGNQRASSLALQTPLRIGRFDVRTNVSVNDRVQDFPQRVQIFDVNTGQITATRTYNRTYRTDLNFDTQFSLPGIFQGSWNVTPFVSIVNADQSNPFWVRTTLSGGRFVQQSKKLQYGLGISPTFFGFFPGFGPFARLRHSIQPRISYSFSPASNVSTDFLQALGLSRANYLGGLRQNALTFQLNQVLEAKVRTSDTTQGGGQKLRLLAIDASPLTYDFEVARKTHRFGLTTPTFSYRLSSDLLPGFDFSSNYSLFQGNPLSDTAKFKPFRTGYSLSFTIGKSNNPFATLTRLFGNAAPADSSPAGTAAAAASGQGAFQTPPIAGAVGSRYPLGVNTAGGWSLTVSLSSARSRPISGSNVKVLDPRALCQVVISDPIAYSRCLANPPPQDTVSQLLGGATAYVSPPQTTLRASTSLNVTPRWSMQWTTGYDFERHQFSDHVVSLQRDMHDWRAIFAFTEAPNGNFAFNFYISLIAEPDLKFDYNRRTYRPPPVP